MKFIIQKYFEAEEKTFKNPLIFVKKMKPEVRRFVNAQKRKKIITVENMYRDNLRKEKRKNKSILRAKTS